MHGGAFLTCGANTHGRLTTMISHYADSPVLVLNYRMIPKHSVGMALDDCYEAYKWLRLKGYEPEQTVRDKGGVEHEQAEVGLPGREQVAARGLHGGVERVWQREADQAGAGAQGSQARQRTGAGLARAAGDD